MSATKPPRPGTIRWAAKKLNYCVPTTRKHIAAGRLRTYGKGHGIRITEQAVADFIAALERENATGGAS